jgi:hypothetical protein
MYSAGFGTTLIALTMITSIVILAVTSNVVLSLGMVGALSIVRFRTAIKEPLDIAFLFWAIGAGIVLAAGLIPLAVILILLAVWSATEFFELTQSDHRPVIAVLVEDSESGRWTQLRLGLEQAQQDYNVRIRFVQTGRYESVEDQLVQAGAAAKEGAVFTNIRRLRLKESDRVMAVEKLIQSLGGKTESTENELTVYGTGLTGGTVNSYNDHRIAMAAAIAATVCSKPVTISDAEAVDKSYPSFWNEYRKLGGLYEQYLR